MPLSPRRKGYLSNLVRDMEEKLRRVRPQRTPGLLTSETTGGATRRPTAQRSRSTATASDTWA